VHSWRLVDLANDIVWPLRHEESSLVWPRKRLTAPDGHSIRGTALYYTHGNVPLLVRRLGLSVSLACWEVSTCNRRRSFSTTSVTSLRQMKMGWPSEFKSGCLPDMNEHRAGACHFMIWKALQHFTAAQLAFLKARRPVCDMLRRSLLHPQSYTP
jgi:hypothetical protein